MALCTSRMTPPVLSVPERLTPGQQIVGDTCMADDCGPEQKATRRADSALKHTCAATSAAKSAELNAFIIKTEAKSICHQVAAQVELNVESVLLVSTLIAGSTFHAGVLSFL